ncbi:hypothetical protein SDRG_06311 [Saprolegnia diclina VS20]|uniref:AAA+ ATPase domain-containing protein n=1 Tax=Saprolegnia diclina (strain VS20) TaxID=1156394 RepID=T0QNA8_SAPDV|nr:hypothetical protein SDRG_06311 [Saprolegnia diclina VS20]EQC36201.1 hypothetical protein SDRG_06311 [Saprolegnia diclina VS20]|eukprot:XP_008610307.1 hypothetical protein SDRG_06311 [Saprolegnia diclina VS20]
MSWTERGHGRGRGGRGHGRTGGRDIAQQYANYFAQNTGSSNSTAATSERSESGESKHDEDNAGSDGDKDGSSEGDKDAGSDAPEAPTSDVVDAMKRCAVTVSTRNVQCGTAKPAYSMTYLLESEKGQPALIIGYKSISMMDAYAHKSVEELRFEDYLKRTDKEAALAQATIVPQPAEKKPFVDTHMVTASSQSASPPSGQANNPFAAASATSTSGFSFGTSAPSTSTFGASSATSTSGFSFGSSAPSTSGFSFGSSSAPTTRQPSSFSFGGTASSSSTSGFSFGATATPVPHSYLGYPPRTGFFGGSSSTTSAGFGQQSRGATSVPFSSSTSATTNGATSFTPLGGAAPAFSAFGARESQTTGVGSRPPSSSSPFQPFFGASTHGVDSHQAASTSTVRRVIAKPSAPVVVPKVPSSQLMPALELHSVSMDWKHVYVISTLDDLRRGFDKLPDVARLATYKGNMSLEIVGPAFPNTQLQLGMTDFVVLIDCEQIPLDDLVAQLSPLLQSTTMTKIIFDAHRMGAALSSLTLPPLAAVLDLQIAMEVMTKEYAPSFASMLSRHNLESHPYPRYLQAFKERPRSDDAIRAAMWTSYFLLKVAAPVRKTFADKSILWHAASMERVTNAIAAKGVRTLSFDVKQQHKFASYEVLHHLRPSSLAKSTPLVVHEDMGDVFALLPPEFAAPLQPPDVAAHLLDIVLDLGRRPWAWVNGARFFLLPHDEARVVCQNDLDLIVDRVGGFGSDDRAGLERQLHRISAVRNRSNEIIGLTIRVGRYIEGNASLIADILAKEDKNILFLGEPGCGKTTIVREVSRQLANKYNVCIVDTSNEIAGDGNIPHMCVGLARRMMVPSLDKQAAVMVQVVQNHTPEVMVIDEIGRPNEVEAARTCKQRGVRIVASAHGDLRKLLKNKPLRGLVGGIQNVTLSDKTAKEQQQKNDGDALRKVVAERGGAPIFEVIVELRRGQYDTWRIISNAADAVDAILNNSDYETQVRTRTADGNAFLFNTEKL